MSRCEGCPVDPSFACHALTAGLLHWCVQRTNDPAIDAFLVANSRPGVEPVVDRSVPTPPTPIDPRLVLIDTCDFLASCSCHEARRCLQFGEPSVATRQDCLDCASKSLPNLSGTSQVIPFN